MWVLKHITVLNTTSTIPEEYVISRDKLQSSINSYPGNPEKMHLDKEFKKRYEKSNFWELDNLKSLNNTSANLIGLRHVYVNSFGGIIYDEEYFYKREFTHGPNGSVIEDYPKAMIFETDRMGMYAHILIDFFGPFFGLNETTRKTMPIIVGFSQGLSTQLYELMGYDTNNLIHIYHYGQYIHVQTLYIVDSRSNGNFNLGYPFYLLSKRLHECLELDRAKPSVYLLYNRPGNKRNLTDFNEIVEEIKKNFPQYNWQVTVGSPTRPIKTAALFWNAVKLVFMPTGSNVANVVYMQSTACVCIQVYSWCDRPAIFECYSCNVSVYVTTSYKCNHWFQGSGCFSNKPTVIKSIELAIDYQKKIDCIESPNCTYVEKKPGFFENMSKFFYGSDF